MILLLLLLLMQQASGMQTCETILIQVKKGAMELETRLEECLSQNAELSAPKPAAPQDDDDNNNVVGALQICNQQLDDTRLQIEHCQANTTQTLDLLQKSHERNIAAQQETHASALKQINLKHAKQVEAAKLELQEEHNQVETQLRQEILALQEQLFALAQERNKKDARLDWTSHLANLSLVLGVTEERMHQMSIESLVYLLDDETSNQMSGYLTWSILLLPAVLSFCLLLRVKLSLARMVLWATLYCALLFLCLFGFSILLQAEAVQSLPRGGIHDVLVVLLLVAQLVLFAAISMLTLKQWLVEDLGGLRVRHLIQVFLPTLVCVHYYQFYFYGAILNNNDEEEDEEGTFGAYTWLAYSLAYLMVCACIALSRSRSDLVKAEAVEEVQEQNDEPRDLEEAVARASSPPSQLQEEGEGEDPSSSTTTTTTKKKKKKSKGGLEEVLDKVADAVNTEINKPSTKQQGKRE